MLTTLVSFILVLGVLVFIHEFGHFVLAKRAGVYVEAFSFGFGPRLIGWKRGGTDYRICAIPLGGYVKMVGEDPKDEGAGRVDSFAAKSVWARLKIVVAGPLMNLALPFLLMPLVYLLGVEQPAYLNEPPVVGWVVPDSPGQKAGFQIGDRILAIQSEETPTWEKALLTFAANLDKPLPVEVLRDGSRVELEVTPESAGWGPPNTGLLQAMPPALGELEPGSPAEAAGLKAGDRVVAVDQAPVRHWEQMSEIIRSHPGQSLLFTYEREGQTQSVAITPRAVTLENESSVRQRIRGVLERIRIVAKSEPQQTEVVGQVGIRYLQPSVLVHYGLWESIRNGARHIGEITVMTFDVLGKLVTGSVSPKTLGGPIIIAKMTGDAARHGLSNLLSFMAILSLQLGILNLLPIPVLDGGHVLFLSLEAVRRKPLSLRVRDLAQQVGFFLLIGFFLYISYNDLMRLVP